MPPPRRSPSRRRAQPRRQRASVRAGAAFDRLVRIMAVLRSPQGCAWDRRQTHASLRPYLIEETYEAIDAIDRGAFDELAGELGDVLLQCVFHAQVAAEGARFDMRDVIDAITLKLIHRHPHVFTARGRPLSAAARRRAGVNSPAAVREQWQQLKTRERAARNDTAGLLAGLPRALPALLRAHAIGSRVASVGFDWPAAAGVLDKIDEEVRELRAALEAGHAERVDEFGDLLFSLANLARKLDIEPELALAQANDKFTRRFEALEADFAARGARVEDASPADLDRAWTRIKAVQAAAARSTPARATSARESRGRRSRR